MDTRKQPFLWTLYHAIECAEVDRDDWLPSVN